VRLQQLVPASQKLRLAFSDTIRILQVLWRLKQEDCEFKARLGYLIRPCLKKKKKSLKISGRKSNNKTILGGEELEDNSVIHSTVLIGLLLCIKFFSGY
jgi:hypothetical protein